MFVYLLLVLQKERKKIMMKPDVLGAKVDDADADDVAQNVSEDDVCELTRGRHIQPREICRR